MSATTAIMGLVAAASLVAALTGHYLSGSYRLAVVSVTVLGTLISDDLVDNLGLARCRTGGVLRVSVRGLRWLVLHRAHGLDARVHTRRASNTQPYQ